MGIRVKKPLPLAQRASFAARGEGNVALSAGSHLPLPPSPEAEGQ